MERRRSSGRRRRSAAPPAPRGREPWQRTASPPLPRARARLPAGVWIVYPTIRTIVRSFFDRDGDEFVGFDNYKDAVHERHAHDGDQEQRALGRVVPALVTAIGLDLRRADRADPLVDRVQDGRLHADGDLAVRGRRDLAADGPEGPDQGAVNATHQGRRRRVQPAGVLSTAQPSTRRAARAARTAGSSSRRRSSPGGVALLGLTGDPARARCPGREAGGRAARPLRGGINGVVWRDFKPGGGTPGKVEQRRARAPGRDRRAARLRRQDGRRATTTEPNGTFAFDERRSRAPTASAIGADTFADAVRGRLLARAEADHARDHDRLHLGLGRLRDGGDRGRAGGDPARRARGGAHRRRHRVAGLPARHRAAARAGAHRRLHHDADQRPEGLRHRARRSRRARRRTTRT